VGAALHQRHTASQGRARAAPHVLWNGYNTAVSWQLREDDVSPIFTPLYHAGGLGAFLVPIFTIGGTIVLHAAFDAAEVWRTVEASAAPWCSGADHLEAAARGARVRGTDLSTCAS